MSSCEQKKIVSSICLKRGKKKKIRRLKRNRTILYWDERKWHLTWNLATILLLKSKLSRKLQRFNAIDGRSIEMLKNSWLSETFN